MVNQKGLTVRSTWLELTNEGPHKYDVETFCGFSQLMALLRCSCSTGSTNTTTANRLTADQLWQLYFYNNKYVHLTFLCPAQVNLRKIKLEISSFTPSVKHSWSLKWAKIHFYLFIMFLLCNISFMLFVTSFVMPFISLMSILTSWPVND